MSRNIRRAERVLAATGVTRIVKPVSCAKPLIGFQLAIDGLDGVNVTVAQLAANAPVEKQPETTHQT
ncbi:hypothetical protein [Sphingorhabdus buctiana]|uniref:hypothetical protein n=1 Tax=Sphingorhabdus buctiana TaxID=1508805 RepID=UPI0036D22D2E